MKVVFYQGFVDAEDFLAEELRGLVETGQAIVLPERPQHRGPVGF